MTRILGIDPGSRFTGYGIIESDGYYSEYIASGCVKAAEEIWSQRLGVIFNGVQELLIQYAPDEVAIEKVFIHRNADSALKLGQASRMLPSGARVIPNIRQLKLSSLLLVKETRPRNRCSI